MMRSEPQNVANLAFYDVIKLQNLNIREKIYIFGISRSCALNCFQEFSFFLS